MLRQRQCPLTTLLVVGSVRLLEGDQRPPPEQPPNHAAPGAGVMMLDGMAARRCAAWRADSRSLKTVPLNEVASKFD